MNTFWTPKNDLMELMELMVFFWGGTPRKKNLPSSPADQKGHRWGSSSFSMRSVTSTSRPH